MPIDPFFTSAHKRHFVATADVDDEYNRIMALPYKERRAYWEESKRKHRAHELTHDEWLIHRRMGFTFKCAHRRWVHQQAERHRNSAKAIRRRRLIKKLECPVVFGGYNTK